MEKTQFQVEISKQGSMNAEVLNLVALHNEGKLNIDLNFIKQFLLLEQIKYPGLQKQLQSTIDTKLSCIHISEDLGRTNTLTIDLITYHELKEVEENEDEFLDTLSELNIFPKEFQPQHPIVKQAGAQDILDNE